MLRDETIYYRCDTYLSPQEKHREMIMRVMHHAPLVGFSRDLYEHEVPHSEDFLYNMVSIPLAWT
jgi:hypothetical protein